MSARPLRSHGARGGGCDRAQRRRPRIFHCPLEAPRSRRRHIAHGRRQMRTSSDDWSFARRSSALRAALFQGRAALGAEALGKPARSPAICGPCRGRARLALRLRRESEAQKCASNFANPTSFKPDVTGVVPGAYRPPSGANQPQAWHYAAVAIDARGGARLGGARVEAGRCRAQRIP